MYEQGRAYLTRCLEAARHNVRRTAQIAGIERKYMYKLLRKYHIRLIKPDAITRCSLGSWAPAPRQYRVKSARTLRVGS